MADFRIHLTRTGWKSSAFLMNDRYFILFLTHSSRVTDYSRCSLNFLTQRYADPDRLKKLPPFESLKPADYFYAGAVSAFRVLVSSGNKVKVDYLGMKKSDHKIQHVVMMDSRRLVVCYEHFIEMWEFETPVEKWKSIAGEPCRNLRTYNHPFFAGLHTVFPVSDKMVAVSASAPDAVLMLNVENGVVEKILRMPEELYGKNYDLSEDMDLHKHYINNDCQTTHINCAYPDTAGDKIIVSTLIQGAVGVFDWRKGSYKEITRGFVGCHGSRMSREGRIYFADSVTGSLVFIDDEGRIQRRFKVNSRWLHDATQLSGDIYAFSVSDHNTIAIYDINKNTLLYEKRFFTLPATAEEFLKKAAKYTSKTSLVYRIHPANSTQFMSVFEYGGQ